MSQSRINDLGSNLHYNQNGELDTSDTAQHLKDLNGALSVEWPDDVGVVGADGGPPAANVAVPVSFPANIQAGSVSPTEASVYERSQTLAARNILATTPPAQTSRYSSNDAAAALLQMMALKNGEPFKAGLAYASESGTAPAVPKASTSSASNATATATDASKAGGYSVDASKIGNQTDLNAFSDADIQAAQKMRDETSDVRPGATSCQGKQYEGENKRIDQLTSLGMNYDKAAQIARFLDSENTNSNTLHNDQDEQTVALSIIALQKLDQAGNTDAKNIMLGKLNDIADQMVKSTDSKADGEAYFSTINALGQYALAASADAASVSLTSPTVTAPVLYKPYNPMSD